MQNLLHKFSLLLLQFLQLLEDFGAGGEGGVAIELAGERYLVADAGLGFIDMVVGSVGRHVLGEILLAVLLPWDDLRVGEVGVPGEVGGGGLEGVL